MPVLATLLAAFALTAVPGSALAADAAGYTNAAWTQASITEPDGTVLHADILRDKSVALDAAHRQPTVVSIGPYFNRSGQTGPTDAAYDPVAARGPSTRFADFVEGSGLLSQGYSFVMVDLRGYGGSTGCQDWGGPGEQADVVESIKWIARQPWSDGHVGTYGKSYDAMTGLIGVGLRPPGLDAVVAQEPVYDDYRYLFGDGMRRANFAGTPGIYTVQAATPGGLMDDPMYNISGANDVDTAKPGCKPVTVAEQATNDDHYSPYWRSRNFITAAKGSDVPLFITQGLTEANTVADGFEQFLNAHTGPERAWIGPWDHVRGAERATASPTSPLKMGRDGWYAEVMSFYDEHLRGIAPATAYPNFAVQTNDGHWRGEQQWPPADTARYTSELNKGDYTDNGTGTKTGSGANAISGVWTFSPALTGAAHMVGSGRISLDVRSDVPHGNLAVDVYDLAPVAGGGTWSGPLITRQAHLIYNNGLVDLDLWSVDWKLVAGHRIGVRVTDTNTDWWGDSIDHRQVVNVFGGTVTLPFVTHKRTDVIQGSRGTMLTGYLADKVTVPATLVTSGSSGGFVLPPPLAAGSR